MSWAQKAHGTSRQLAVVLLAMVLILLVPLGAALADEETFTASIDPPVDTDFSLPLSLPQFDPSQGALLSAEVILTARVAGFMGIENTSPESGGTATIQLAAEATVALASDPGTPLAAAALPGVVQEFELTAFDGVVDFDGDSGANIADPAVEDTTTGVITDAATLAELTGTATVDFVVDAVGTSFATLDTGNVETQFSTQAGADLTIIYQFDQGEIQIVKTPDLQTVEVGADAEFTIEVTNTGPVDLFNVEVTDPLAPDCDNVIGDLAVGESTTYMCTATNVTDPFTNVATVDGEDINGNPVTDDDDAEVVLGGDPVISIEKSTNGEDADTPTGPEIAVGDAVAWEYVVTNDGDEGLTDVVVVDDQGVTVACPQDTLDAGESMTCTATGIAVAGQYANVGTVTGSGIDSGTAVTASDPSHYFGTSDPATPAIQIVKNPNSQILSKGDTATFTITVTNPGPVDLINVVVTDPMAPDCDATIGPLAVDESSTYTCTVANVQAGFTNVATTTGEDDEGTQVTDSDDAVVTIGLPETGAPFGELAGFGAALLLAGLALVGVRRRYQS